MFLMCSIYGCSKNSIITEGEEMSQWGGSSVGGSIELIERKDGFTQRRKEKKAERRKEAVAILRDYGFLAITDF